MEVCQLKLVKSSGEVRCIQQTVTVDVYCLHARSNPGMSDI